MKKYTYSEKCRLHIEKLRKINTGRARTHSSETRKKMSESKKGVPSPMRGVPRPDMKGEKHFGWKGGIKNRHKKFGISQGQYDELSEHQGCLCAICDQPEKVIDRRTGKIKALAIDHCHTSKKIRGLLCNWCNTGLGQFKDNVDLLRKAISYLETK